MGGLHGAADGSRTRQQAEGVAAQAGVPFAMIRAALLAAAAAIALPAAAQVAKPTANFDAPAKSFGRVSYDARSLMIDGKRTIIWSSEMHAFRLPSPDLWRDVLQKM